MKNKQKGFSLLEAVCALLLFGLMIQFLMQFFIHMYDNSKYSQKQAVLMDNARNVNTFVKEKIREADSVKIVLDPSDTINPITDSTTNVSKSGKLKQIILEPGPTGAYIELRTIPSGDDKKGACTLYYVKSGVDTPISDMISSINVKRDAGSDEVIFECEYHAKVPDKLEREKVQDTFSESLAYKQVIP